MEEEITLRALVDKGYIEQVIDSKLSLFTKGRKKVYFHANQLWFLTINGRKIEYFSQIPNTPIINMKNIDTKTIIIVILCALLLFQLYFKKSEIISLSKTDFEQVNSELYKKIDSIKLVNKNIDILIQKNNLKMDSVLASINQANSKIKQLEKRLYENNRYVSTLNANGVANAISNFLETKSNK